MVDTKMKTMPAVVARLYADQRRPAGVGLRWLPRLRDRGERNKDGGLRNDRIPGRQPRVGADQERARDNQHAGAAHSGGERKRNAGEHQTRRMRADHDRKPAKRGKRAGDALPAQALKAGRGSRESR